MAILLGCVIAGGLVYVHGFAVANCQQIEAVKTVVRQVIEQGAQTLGRPGTAGYDYYRTHGSELQAARDAAHTEALSFAPRPCN